MPTLFQNNTEPFRKPKSFVERFQDIFVKPISPVPEEPDKRNFLEKMGDLFFPPSEPTSTPTPTPTPTPLPVVPLEDIFRKGFSAYGSDLATASAEFAKKAKEFSLPDPLLPAVLALMETSGGKKQKFKFNPFNWGMQDMPNLQYTIDRIYSGIAERFPYYKEYLQTGNIRDFFKKYTPEGPDNPTLDELEERYYKLRKYFEE